MVKIALCEDHEIVRKGLRQIIQEHPGFNVLLEVSSGEQLLKELRKVKPDIIILDISLPGRSGLEVIKQLNLTHLEIKVLVLSMYPEDQFAIRAIKAGASGYLHKDSPPNILFDAIRTIADGGKYVSPVITNLLFREIASERKNALHKSLSDREFEVLLQIGHGKKINEIAKNMSLSAKTISTYKTRIFTKLNIHNVPQATQFLLKQNLLQDLLEGQPYS